MNIPAHYAPIYNAIMGMRRIRGSVFISYREIHEVNPFSSEQVVLAILKEYGAPIDGVFLLMPVVEGYEWRRDEDMENRGFRISWKKVDAVKNPDALDNSDTTKGD